MKLYVVMIWALMGFAWPSLAAKKIGNPKAPVGGTYYLNLDAEPSGLHPLKGTDGYASSVQGYVFDSLLTRNEETFNLEPALAESYEVAKDGMSITFVIREGAKFHDGNPITIEDVKFSFDVNFDSKLADAVRKLFFENFDKAEIIDKKTIKFYIKNKYFKNLEVVGGMEILPKAIYGKVDKKLNKTMLGSGPYKLEQYDRGQKITLVKNKDWWGFNVDSFKGHYNFERVVFRFIKDETAKLESFKKGDLDFLGLNPEQYEKKTDGPMWGKNVHKKAVENSTAKGTAFIGFNLRRPIFKDKEVRHGLSQLFNREFMIEKFFYGKYLAATGPWYAQSPYADPNTKAVKFNPKSAREKFKKAGWADTNKDGILDKVIDGKLTNFSFELLHGGGPWEKYLTIYKEELKKSGIELKLKQLEWNAFQKTLNDWNFDTVALAWGGVVEYDPKQIWHSQSITKDGSNFAGYSNPVVDKLIDEARIEMNESSRRKKMQKVFSIVASDHPYIFFYTPKYTLYGHSDRVKMIEPTYKYTIGSHTWWIAP